MQALLDAIVQRCGAAAVVAPDETATRGFGLRGEHLAARPLLRPGSTEEVAFIVQQARAAGVALIPVGGATGLVGALRASRGDECYLSLERMRAIERIDPVSRVAVVQAGVVLQVLQEAAAAQGLLFAVDLGGRGSATVGGLIGTNAGGERVLRFGMMREQVLGLEVVTADGQVLDLMNEVLKNNSGYDLKQLFIGSEGTLGIVTRAVLRLRPGFDAHEAAWLALPSLDQLPQVLAALERGLGGSLSAFELMWPEFMHMQCGVPGAPHRWPLAEGAAGYVLVEAEGSNGEAERARLLQVLEGLLESGAIADATVAQSEAERQAFWAIRNDVRRIGDYWAPLRSLDVSVPVARMVGYVDELRAALRSRWPQSRLLVFGHVADNNLHVVVTVGPDTHAQAKAIEELVYDGVRARSGSISAEHGIGLDKRAALHASQPPQVLALMRQLKAMMDPQGLLNPGKVV